MNEAQLNRKLPGIFGADDKGYSRLMGQDDVGTVPTLKNCHQIMNAEIQRHHGRE
jgi:adenylate cyclase